METQTNISSKQVIINLLRKKRSNWIDVKEIFFLQDYINRINDGSILINIKFDDIRRTVQYYEELFIMSGYRITLKKGDVKAIENICKLPRKISVYFYGYIKESNKRGEYPSLFKQNF